MLKDTWGRQRGTNKTSTEAEPRLNNLILTPAIVHTMKWAWRWIGGELLYNHSGPVNPAAERAQGWKIVNGQIRRGRVSTNRWATDFLDLWFKHRSKTQVLDLRLDMLTPVSDIRQVYFAESYEKFSYFFQE